MSIELCFFILNHEHSFRISCIRTPLPVTGMVTELIRDNSILIDAVTDTEVSSILDLLRTNKNPEYLEILAVLCVCERSAVPGKQKLITEKLFADDCKNVLFTTKFDKETRAVQLCVSGSGREAIWQPLETYEIACCLSSRTQLLESFLEFSPPMQVLPAVLAWARCYYRC